MPPRTWVSGPKRRDNKKLFFDRVYPEPNTGCWLYCGSYSKEGYGKLTAEYFNGFRSTHRFSYFLHFGDFDRRLCVMHSCDNPTCVNPDHLSLGTHADNMADKLAKGRFSVKGEKNPKAKLCEQDIRDIRQLSKSGLSHRKIAAKYQVGKTSITYAINGKSWGFVQ